MGESDIKQLYVEALGQYVPTTNLKDGIKVTKDGELYHIDIDLQYPHPIENILGLAPSHSQDRFDIRSTEQVTGNAPDTEASLGINVTGSGDSSIDLLLVNNNLTDIGRVSVEQELASLSNALSHDTHFQPFTYSLPPIGEGMDGYQMIVRFPGKGIASMTDKDSWQPILALMRGIYRMVEQPSVSKLPGN